MGSTKYIPPPFSFVDTFLLNGSSSWPETIAEILQACPINPGILSSLILECLFHYVTLCNLI